MEALTIKTPADVLSFIGHTLGFWPRESLVCITLAENHVGATLRVDLPKPGAEISYAQTVAGYLAHDAKAASVLFAVYTSLPTRAGRVRPHAATIAALTGALAERGMTIRDGLLVGDDAVSQYDGEPGDGPSLPLAATEYSQINAEFVYRGSTIASTNRIALPAPPKETQAAAAVERCMKSIQRLNIGTAMDQARTLWTGMLATKTYPNDQQTIGLIANLQFPTIRDQLMADIPGIDEPLDQVLLAQTQCKPQWSRIEWAEQMLVHAYTHSSTKHAAPILTAIAFINWWEGRGSKAHQFLQLALEADPDYRLARLSDQMIGSGMVAGWNMDRNTAYRNHGLETS
ncbi:MULTISPECIES: DUF4192 domain-containing protein [unclassified Arthrobacter]|uniref:DUF4192 domain-containing protein n=1 Tax=unclassified Arthrobacter TaxID=235627 RepID=UPI002DFC4A95|nr:MULTISPECIES: DUF4192 domain-containing protein [unclassified Arthrobacter]MEC5193295.1 hypothetical protein [Arthrobacter sp. MP_M4]MEC5204761.1 hypothetical protein [Arthrobacter sp. MP_M7]